MMPMWMYLVMAVLTVIPFWIFLPTKFNLPAWFAFAALTPFTVLVLLWVMAFRDKITIPGVDK
jgi:hypothetical protein